MKKLMFLFVFLITIASVSAAISHVRPSTVDEDSVTRLYFTVRNPTSNDWDDVTMTIYSPGLDIYERSARFDLDDKKSTRVNFNVDIPESKHGYYFMKLNLYGDGVRRTEYTFLKVE